MKAAAQTDEYWVGALSMAAARAHAWLRQAQPERAFRELDAALERFGRSPVMDDNLRKELARFWPAREETP